MGSKILGFWSSFSTLFRYPRFSPAEKMAGAPQISGLFTSDHTGAHHSATHTWKNTLTDPRTFDCFVGKVEHCKLTASGSKHHEFLRFTILSPDSAFTATVIAHRAGAANINSKSDKSKIISNSHSSHDVNYPADDIVAACTMGTTAEDNMMKNLKPFKVVRKIEYPPSITRPSARHICTLLESTSTSALFYTLYENQCYWFAKIVTDALAELFPGATVTESAGPPTLGTHFEIPINTSNNLQEVIKIYKEKWCAVGKEREEVQRAQEETMP
ncbi:hypothetical protein V8E55_006033 [Tylopilus felleus]